MTECVAMVEPMGIEVYQNGGLIMETIAKLQINLPWIVPVESAKSQAVIQLHAFIADVQRRQRQGVLLGESLADRQVYRGVGRQINPGILGLRRSVQPVGEPRAIVHVRRGVGLPRQAGVVTHIQGVTLVVVDGREPWRDIEDQTSGDR